MHTKNKIVLSLKDNTSESGITKTITDDNTKNVLRYLSGRSLKDIHEKEKILIFPYSFQKTKDEIADSFILNYFEDKNGIPDKIITSNLVGFIGYKNVEISIHSRFSNSLKNDNFLYYMLCKVGAINSFNLDTSAKDNNPIFDFLLFFFPDMLKKAMAQGLFKNYVYKEYNDANVKGSIDISRHIRKNIPFNGKIAYCTREHSYDNHITQLIRHTIELIRKNPIGRSVLNNDLETKKCIQQIIQATPTYAIRNRERVIYENLKPIVHPYYLEYTNLQKLCLRILRHKKISYGESDKKIHGILIDAAWLWEEFVASVLREKHASLSLQHYTRKNSNFYLFKDSRGAFQKIIPDYYNNVSSSPIVGDAKYIPLDDDDQRSIRAERAEGIYYKSLMYMLRFNSKEGYLFYPYQETKITECNKDYQIIDTDSVLYIRGLKISQKNDFKQFCEEMNSEHTKFDFKKHM